MGKVRVLRGAKREKVVEKVRDVRGIKKEKGVGKVGEEGGGVGWVRKEEGIVR